MEVVKLLWLSKPKVYSLSSLQVRQRKWVYAMCVQSTLHSVAAHELMNVLQAGVWENLCPVPQSDCLHQELQTVSNVSYFLSF